MNFYSYSKYLISSFIIVACCLQQCCFGQSTTVRPYKFGFTIDEQQHRREMRDERGIVMGEFGFITADGIYHVTVYATDEQGRFRILAMKNYPYESPPKTVEVMVQPKAAPMTTTAKPLMRHNFNTEACSGCFLRNGKNKPKGSNEIEGKSPKKDITPLSKTLPNPSAGSSAKPNETPSTGLKPTTTQGTTANSPTSNTFAGNPPPIMDIIMQEVLPTLMGKKGQTTAAAAAVNPAQSTTLNNKANTVPTAQKPSSNSASFDGSRNSAGSAGPSAVNGKGDGDLYRFKYILDYHGHTETGKRNGNKEGSYFIIGDDNVERTIEYVANELGYQPRIRWRKLNSNEIKPKENTLKDYEFVWFQK